MLKQVSQIVFLALLLVAVLGACNTTEEAPDNTLSRASSSGVEPTATAVPPTFTTTATPSPTLTATPTPDYSPTPGPSLTPSNTPSPSPTGTDTPVPTATPTSRPQEAPTLVVTGVGMILEGQPQITAVPSPVPTFEIPSTTTNVMLLGGDLGERGDTLIIVSINGGDKTASMLSIPRDLLVYEPNSLMRPINTVEDPEQLKQTILYNFGVPIHYYAFVDFQGFTDIVNAINGVDMTVTCSVRDIWELKEPGLDPMDIDNWEWHTLEPGIYHMDGDLALWYARSRRTSTDYERGRRQQQLLRAILNQSVDVGLIPQVPAMWSAFQGTVQTDMDIGKLLQLAAIAPAVRENGVQNLYLRGKAESWVIPADSSYLPNKQTLIPIWEGDNMMEETFRRLFLPPALSKSSGPPITVEIINATDNPDMAAFAAENLASYGFVPIIGVDAPAPDSQTELHYYAPNLKGIPYDWLLPWVVGLRQSNIILVDDQPDYPYTYQVIIGDDYDPCLDPTSLHAPRLYLD